MGIIRTRCPALPITDLAFRKPITSMPIRAQNHRWMTQLDMYCSRGMNLLAVGVGDVVRAAPRAHMITASVCPTSCLQPRPPARGPHFCLAVKAQAGSRALMTGGVRHTNYSELARGWRLSLSPCPSLRQRPAGLKSLSGCSDTCWGAVALSLS